MNGHAGAAPRRKQAIGSYQDIAVLQAKSLHNKDDVAALSQTMKSIGILLNYLTAHGEHMTVRGASVREFERLTQEQIPKLTDDSVLHRILRTSGWVGSHYQFSAESPVDVAPMKQMLATLYLSSAAGGGASAEAENDDGAVIKSFCPDTLVRCVLKGSIKNLFTQENAATSDGALAAAAAKAAKNTSNGELSLLLPHELTGAGHRSESFFGTCMLVDISGFTKLSAALCTKGSAGLDDLHLAISGYLGRCVDIVYAYGGDVISFAGDALICVFSHPSGRKGDEEKTSLVACAGTAGGDVSNDQVTDFHESPLSGSAQEQTSPSVLAAVRCAMELKEHCTDTLTAHIAVSCGEMSFAMLGGHNKEYIYMVVGDCINEIATCIDDAKSKQLVVTPAVAEWLTKYFFMINENKNRDPKISTTVMDKTGNVRIDSFSGSIMRPSDVNRLDSIASDEEFMEMLRKFVPPTVLDSLTTNSFHVCAQLREVTTMFLKLDSFDASVMAESVPLLQRFFFGAQEILAECGGFMRQFLVDDKGCVLIAMWGVPSFTHANNCFRALHAAGKLAQQTRAMHHRCSIGITTGHVFCGTVGSVARRDYVGIGSTVNMSARLMGKAKGRIVIDMDTYSRLPLGARPLLREIEPLQLKGLDEPVTAYECTSSTAELASFAVEDEDDESGQVVRLQRNIVKAFRKQLNALVTSSSASMDCSEKEHSQRNSGSKSKSMGQGPGWHLTMFNRLDCDLGDSNRIASRRPSVEPVVKSFRRAAAGAHDRDRRKSLGKENSASFSYTVAKASKFTKYEAHSYDALVSFSIVQGPAGSGKTAAADYARRAARSRGLRCVYVRARSGDENNVFGVIGKLLVELIGPDELISERRQKATLKRLLLQIFPKQDPMVLLSRSKTLKAALGYKWLYAHEATVPYAPMSDAVDGPDPIEGGSKRSATGLLSNFMSSDREFSINPSFKQMFGGSRRPASIDSPLTVDALAVLRNERGGTTSVNDSYCERAPVEATVASLKHDRNSITRRSRSRFDNGTHVLTQLMLLLLKQAPTVVVIDDAHYADELSWAEVRNTLDMPVQLAVILTTLSRANAELTMARPGTEVVPPVDARASAPGAAKETKNVEHSVMESKNRVSTKNMRYASNASIAAIREHSSCVVLDMLPLGEAEVHHLLTDTLLQENRRTQALRMKNSVTTRAFVGDSVSVSATCEFSASAAAATHRNTSKECNAGQVLASTPQSTSIMSAIFQVSSAGYSTGKKLSGTTLEQQLIPPLAPSVETSVPEQVTPELVNSVLRVSNGNAYWCRAIADFIAEHGVNDFMHRIYQANELLDSDSGFSPGSRASFGELDSASFGASAGSYNASPHQQTNRNSFAQSPHMTTASVHRIRLKRGCNPLDVLVVCRLEKLPHHLQSIIKHAAIIGHEFSFNTLRAILPTDKTKSLKKNMEMLLESSFILCTGCSSVDNSESYCFQNCLMRNAIYDLMPPSEASKVHELIAERIEHIASDDFSQHFGSLAPNRRGDAFRYAILTADDCISRKALNDAFYFVQRAALLVSSEEAVTTPDDVRLVLAVVNDALKAIRPAGVVSSIASLLMEARDVMSQSNYENEVLYPAYSEIKTAMETRLREVMLRSLGARELSSRIFTTAPRIRSELPTASNRFGFSLDLGCCLSHADAAVVVPS